MSSRHAFAATSMACLLAVGLFGIAPLANAEGVDRPPRAGKIAGDNAIETKRRFQRRYRTVKIHLPVGPSSVYYDYPYYYCRGFYPTHIGGYVYYPKSYRCTYNWGYRGAPGTAHGLRARGG